ncbi:hypothetical protein [Paraburkholderia sp. RL17-337-BIB-A]|uniref:hypothetical protein n=1 Tax=Paraburkholderia sp. RL17-337-BIB-A TaxID=3031636 RepID=UPI0038BE03D5
MKTSEANLEFSYDSRNRAEVARQSGNIVDICPTLFSSVGAWPAIVLPGETICCTAACIVFFVRTGAKVAPDIARSEKAIIRGQTGKEKPPEGGSHAK